MISYNDFKSWHTANGNDVVEEKTLREAYYLYTMLYNAGGKDYADDKICGHSVWNCDSTNDLKIRHTRKEIR